LESPANDCVQRPPALTSLISAIQEIADQLGIEREETFWFGKSKTPSSFQSIKHFVPSTHRLHRCKPRIRCFREAFESSLAAGSPWMKGPQRDPPEQIFPAGELPGERGDSQDSPFCIPTEWSRKAFPFLEKTQTAQVLSEKVSRRARSKRAAKGHSSVRNFFSPSNQDSDKR